MGVRERFTDGADLGAGGHADWSPSWAWILGVKLARPMVPDDGAHRPANAALARRWGQDWWRVHEREPVSVSVLVKSGVVTETTFHRSKIDLLNSGLIEREGAGNATRYRLTVDPTLG